MADIGFVTIEEANTYFETRYGASTYWNTNTDKTAALVTAHKHLIDCNLFNLALDSGDVIPTVFQDAQCEQALFIIQQAKALDSRMALQAQGVTTAGVVKEQYQKVVKNGIPISRQAFGALTDYRKYGLGFLYDSSDLTDEDS